MIRRGQTRTDGIGARVRHSGAPESFFLALPVAGKIYSDETHPSVPITALPQDPQTAISGSATMNYLTKEQQKVLCVIVLLLLMGLAVKTWRIAHPSQQDGIVAK